MTDKETCADGLRHSWVRTLRGALRGVETFRCRVCGAEMES